MKDNDKVAQALLTLQENAETDFEKLWVERLIEALTNPPRIEQVDAKHQSFNHELYVKEPKGYYKKTVGLHKVVWTYYKGKIPQGLVVHHIDQDKDNNNIENLQLMTNKEHSKMHGKETFTMRDKQKFICQNCGKAFMAFNV